MDGQILGRVPLVALYVAMEYWGEMSNATTLMWSVMMDVALLAMWNLVMKTVLVMDGLTLGLGLFVALFAEMEFWEELNSATILTQSTMMVVAPLAILSPAPKTAHAMAGLPHLMREPECVRLFAETILSEAIKTASQAFPHPTSPSLSPNAIAIANIQLPYLPSSNQ